MELICRDNQPSLWQLKTGSESSLKHFLVYQLDGLETAFKRDAEKKLATDAYISSSFLGEMGASAWFKIVSNRDKSGTI